MDPYIIDFEAKNYKTIVCSSLSSINPECFDEGSVKIFQLNICSAVKNLDSLLLLLSQLKVTFDIIVLTETFQILNTDILSISGYDLLYNHGNINKNDGVLVYISQKFSYKYEVKKLSNIKIIDIDLTGLKNEYFKITAIYRPPSTDVDVFNVDLLNYLSELPRLDVHVICGDININILEEKQDLSYVQEYLNLLGANSYVPYINNVCTWKRNLQESCLDHCFVRSGCSENIRAYLLNYKITDHYPTIIEIGNQKVCFNNQNKNFKDYINYKQLKQDALLIDWNSLYSCEDVDEMTNLFINNILKIVQKNTKKVKISKNLRSRKGWISQSLVKTINKKNELYQNLKIFPSNLTLKQNYRRCKRSLAKSIADSKKQYFEKLINNQQNSKCLWESVNKICNKNKKKEEIERIKINNTIISDKKEIANLFNEHYCSLGERYAQKIKKPQHFIDNEPEVANNMFLGSVSEQEIVRIIRSMKTKKSPGFDGIRTEILKIIDRQISQPLTFLINKCIKKGYFPKQLKIGVISPLLKSGSKLDIINYRPVSLISNVAKIFEKILKSKIMKFLKKYKLISDNQYGFIQGRSTEDAIAGLTSQIYKNLDESSPTLCIFVDLAKAFDTVSHALLLEKIKRNGLRGKIFDIIKSYLSDRIQYTKVGGVLSEAGPVTCGVPQGTVLGPLLFVLYINGLLKMNITGQTLSFADDTAILFKGKTWEEVKVRAEKDFALVKKWFDFNLLTVNLEKTKCILFSPSDGAVDCQGVMVDNQLIPAVKTIKYLGIIIDNNLRWDHHIKYIVQKIRCILPKFRYLKDFLSTSQLKILYFSLVQTHLSYGIIGWGGVLNSHVKSLEVIQKWVLKIIFNKNRLFPSDTLFDMSGVMDVRQLFCYRMILRSFRKPQECLVSSETNYNLRSENKVIIPKCKKTCGQRSYKYLTPRLYNIIPNHIKCCRSFVNFKKKVSDWLMKLCSRDDINEFVNQRQSKY